jgi:uncharacterized membrane protein YjfL (UPF0719 family)
MRLILGILIGFAVLTIAARLHDSSIPEGVNWDVATDLVQRGFGRAREELDKLIAK